MKDKHRHNLERVLNGPKVLQAKIYQNNKEQTSNLADNRISSTKSNLLKSSGSSSSSSESTQGSPASTRVASSYNRHYKKNYNNNNGTQDQSNKKAGATSRHYLMLTLLMIGFVIALISLISILMLPSFVSNQISKKLVLKNNSMLLDRWSKPNIPMYFRVWVFDVVNAQQVVEKRGTKPELREIGPFTFKLKRQKDIVSFTKDNLYYTERRLYHFMPELSCCAINTTVTIPNIPLVAVVDRAMSYQMPVVSRFVPRLINRAIQSLREQLFIKRQVREILFDGYEVQLLKMISRVGSLVGLPQTQQRFAILKGKNNTWRPELDGIWAINTGERDPKRFGKVHSWNSYRKLPFWGPNSQCNTINGSDGSLFVPPIKRDELLYIFNQEICRSVTLVYMRDSEIRNINALRFGLNPLNFARTMAPSKSLLLATATKQRDSPRPVASAWEQEQLVRDAQDQEARMASKMNPYPCFCDRKSVNLNGVNVCEFDGLIDMSKCNKQAQALFGSMPHFYQTDSRLLNQVKGLAPNASKHQTFVDIEPNTGIVLGGKRRVQLNLMIKHNSDVDGFENINDMLVPLVWFEESAQITEETAEKFRSNYTDRVRRMNNILLTLLLGSMILFGINLHLLASNRFGRKSSKWRLGTSSNSNEDSAANGMTNNNKYNSGDNGREFVNNEISNNNSEVNILAGGLQTSDNDESRPESRRESASKSPLLEATNPTMMKDSKTHSSSSSTTPELTRGILSERLANGSPGSSRFVFNNNNNNHHINSKNNINDNNDELLKDLSSQLTKQQGVSKLVVNQTTYKTNNDRDNETNGDQNIDKMNNFEGGPNT